MLRLYKHCALNGTKPQLSLLSIMGKNAAALSTSAKNDELPCDPRKYLDAPHDLSTVNLFDFFCMQEQRNEFRLDQVALNAQYKAF